MRGSRRVTIGLKVRDLKHAIAKLPEEQQSVILLVGLKGMAYAEAAAVVNAPVGTVRSRVARGRETLRAMTGPHSLPGHRGREASCAAPRVHRVDPRLVGVRVCECPSVSAPADPDRCARAWA